MAAEQDTISILLTVSGAPGAPRVPLSISQTVSASELRQLVSAKTEIPLSSLKLIFRGRLIANDDSRQAVGEYKLEEGSVLHCMGKPASLASAAPAAAPPAAVNNFQLQPQLPAVAAAPSLSIPPTAAVSVPPADPLRAALNQLRASCSPPDFLTAVSTLDKVLGNVIGHPMEEKYRKLKKQNASFQRRLGARNGGDAAMTAAGFITQVEDGEELYVMQASAEAWPKLLATKASVEAAVQQAKLAANQPPSMAQPPQVPGGAMPGFGSTGGGAGVQGFGAMGGAGGMPGFGAMGGAGGMGSPEMQRAAAELASNPAQLQAMLQNPMVQNMLRNHPQFANNPMGQQMLEEMMNNPAMLAQLTQMMRDPNAMSRMQAMMQTTGGGGSVPSMGGNNNNIGSLPSFFPPQQAPPGNIGSSNQGQQAGEVGDEQLTEEEMIAEAIRRSLEDGS